MITLLISAQAIAQKVQEIAAAINDYYEEEELTIVMVMKGAFCLTADLVRHLTMPLNIEYVRAKSYGSLGVHRGELTLIGLEDVEITSKHVLLIDDIFDSGHTLSAIINVLKQKNPKSLRSLVLLSKNHERSTSYLPDYILFSIDPAFVVGYGLDYKEHYRNLPEIYIFKETL